MSTAIVKPRLWRTVHAPWLIRPYGARPKCGFVGVLFNPGAWWVGFHWSTGNRRLCFNLLPCVTVWITLPGGNCP